MSPQPHTARIPLLMSLMLALYSLLLGLALVLTAPWWLWQMLRTGKYREGLLERLGRVPKRLTQPDRLPARPLTIWVHAVSVGEVLAASRLVQELRQELSQELSQALPKTVVYLSTTTRTGQALARSRLGPGRVFYFPLDFAFAMRAWLAFLRPSLVVLVESEFWPRMLVECRRAAIPVAVVNARISDRSWPRYQRLRMLWRPLLSTLALAQAQSETDAQRLRSLGATTAQASGNLKYDVTAAYALPITDALRTRIPAGTMVVVCGSTLAGEEALLLDALPLSAIVTILAPRHPERFEEVARLLAARGIAHLRRSRWSSEAIETGQPVPIDPGAALLRPGTVVLLDSIGELASIYSLATLAVLGGGFLWPGGHNPLEPAQFGVPVLMGEHYANFREVVASLQAKKAVSLTPVSGLQSQLARLLADAGEREAMGERGRAVFQQQAGATRRAVTALVLLRQQTAVQAASHSIESGGAREEALK